MTSPTTKHETEEDAITEEEIAVNAPTAAEIDDKHKDAKVLDDESPKKRKSAFTELMTSSARKTHQPKSSKSTKQSSQHWSGHGTPPMPEPGVPSQRFQSRHTLGKYIANPEHFLAAGTSNNPHDPNSDIKFGAGYDTSQVLHYDDNFVVIQDMYPKSQTHLLLLPRSLEHTLLHPFDAFKNRDFLEKVKAEAEKWRRCVGEELRRQHRAVSASEKARNDALAGILSGEEKPPVTNGKHEQASSEGETLPAGRDWASEVLVGTHAVPSMTHLHVHIMSPDRHSPCLRHRKHYNSFSTPFFVPLRDFPLDSEDKRRDPGGEGYLKWGFVCWRCGRGYGNDLVGLKKHLETEFENWRKQ